MVKKAETVAVDEQQEKAISEKPIPTPDYVMAVADLQPGEIGRVTWGMVAQVEGRTFWVRRDAGVSESEGFQVRRDLNGQLEINRWTVNIHALPEREGSRDAWEQAIIA